MRLETFVALRYLQPRRGRGVISVVSAIAMFGFAAGVGALILALAITNGFSDALQQELVGATAHVNLLRKDPVGFPDYRQLMGKLQHIPHVEALAPVVYDEVFLSHQNRSAQATVKGIQPAAEQHIGNILQKVIEGSWQPLQTDPGGRNLLLGKDLADSLGVSVGDWVDVYVPHAVLTPLGYAGRTLSFQVVGIFQTGFADFDGGWVYSSFQAVQQLRPGLNGNSDRASSIEFRLDNIYDADQVAAQAQTLAGPQFATTTWISQNRAIFQALKLERLGTVIVIGLIVFVAALNVLIMLTMLVMEKRKEIAVLLSMGARRGQIRRIFIYQGLILAAAGTMVGLVLSYSLAWAANRYQWIHISAAVYAIDYVPFHTHWRDGLLVTLLSLGVSLLATIYPARRAVQVLPVETLRYE